jgi:hypothetical protein
MFDQIATRLLEGQFICEATAPGQFRELADPRIRDEVDAFLSRLKRRLTLTPNGQAYYATWVRVGSDQRTDAKRAMTTIKQTLRPVIQFIELCMDSQGSDAAPAPGDRLDYATLLKRVAENPHLLERLREFGNLGKEFTASDASPSAMLTKVFQQLERAGYIVLFNREQESWRFTGKLDYYYQVLAFLMENETDIHTEQ